MSCNIDHPKEDVQKKLESQKDFLPADLYLEVRGMIGTELSQETLNEIFHLLKKYDLVSEEEKNERNEALKKLVEKAKFI
ncbi:group-specific protein [Calidifontibacillus erzurumensis]|uniref:Group-specific protein n=1 Tax=Calidifontibacillus erzurumensis TaxID=2741433 RepID=A0A8J8GEN7_9BACI|nr:group-specific protein [Calidifontibacillus erzurumensis]NSL51018.1 group-specific protein [Calidifontibacillus erzurumensis]